MRKTLPTLLLAALTLPWSFAQAKPVDAQLHAKVIQVIQAHEYRPAPKIWKRLGIAPVNTLLAEMALDIKIPVPLRRRATLALAEFSSPRTEATLRALLGDGLVAMEIRRQALMSLGNAFPTTALDAIQPRILAGPTHLREAAVLATIPLIDRRVEPLLLDRLNRETEIAVRSAVERAMKERKLRKKRAQRKKAQPLFTPLRPDQRDGL